VSLRCVVDGQHLFCQTQKSHLVLHACVSQDLCAFGNLLVAYQSNSFHSYVGVVWDIGTECFVFFLWVLGKIFVLKGILWFVKLRTTLNDQ
jgi:hypothetical protein